MSAGLTPRGFLDGKRIFVTGDTGFIGSWLSQWLMDSGAQVRGYALAPATQPNLYSALGLDASIESVRADIRDTSAVSKAVSEFQPQIVFHLAAQPIVLSSYGDPASTFETNVQGTVNVLESLRKFGCAKSIIVVTSDKVYRNHERSSAYRETDALGGRDPYSASKSCADLAVQSYKDSYFVGSGTGIACARLGNVVGGGDWSPYRIVPDIVRALVTNAKAQIRHPQATRPWQHILEPLSGILALAARLWEDPCRFSGEWNFGPMTGEPVTVKELAEMFIHAWGSGSYEILPSGPDALHEARSLQLEVSKAHSELKWTPHLTTRQAIGQSSHWYKEYYRAPGNALELTRGQIADYVRGVGSHDN